jgi:hypothetical protein
LQHCGMPWNVGEGCALLRHQLQPCPPISSNAQSLDP